MTIDLATLTATDRAAHWIVIEREHGPHLSVGPYPTMRDAVHAMENALLIDGLCEEDCLDAYTAPGDDVPDDAETVRIDPNDTDHTAADVVPDRWCAECGTRAGLFVLADETEVCTACHETLTVDDAPASTEPGDAAGPDAWDTYAGELDAAGRHDDANTARERANALVTITDPEPDDDTPLCPNGHGPMVLRGAPSRIAAAQGTWWDCAPGPVGSTCTSAVLAPA